MKSPKVWINGKFLNIEDAKISIFDRGFLYGDGLFETMRAYAGAVFKLDEHLIRLFAASRVMGIKLPYDKTYLKKIINKTLEANGLKGAYIRLTVTRGEGRFGIGYSDRFKPNVVIVAKEFEDYPVRMYMAGIKARVVDIRQNEYSPIPRMKSLNFLSYILARMHAKKEGFDEAVLMNTRGHVAEAATSNIFLVRKKSVITPSLDTGVLPGVTRGVILQISRRMRLNTKEKPVSYRELLGSKEVFFTNSLAEILPVTAVDSHKIGNGRPGEITKLLHISYQKEVIRSVLA